MIPMPQERWKDHIELKLCDRSYYADGPLDTRCWLWAGSLNTGGYGQLNYRATLYIIHRLGWWIYNSDPEEMGVLHRCDIRNCWNPEHLFLGTYQDNVNDMIAKGRNVVHRGVNHPNYQISIEDSAKILALLADGYSQQHVADEYCVSQVLISHIKLGKHWTTQQSQF